MENTELENSKTYEYVTKKPVSLTQTKANAYTNDEMQAWSNYFCNWIWRAVECLVDLKDFNPSIKAIANRLNISVEEAVDALDGLETLRIIRRTPGGFSRNLAEICPSRIGISHPEYLKSHLLVSTEINSRLRDFPNVLMGDYFVSTNREKLKSALQKITSALDELKNNYDKTNDEVFALSFTCASLTATNNSSLAKESIQ